MLRRTFLVAAGAVAVTPSAHADARRALPGGGTVIIPSPYRTDPDYPTYADRAEEALVAYRNWRPTLAGVAECDGMVAIARGASFPSLDAFLAHAKSAVSIQWSDASRIPGQPWTGNEAHYQPTHVEGPFGPELICQLSVHRVRFFRTYDSPAHLFAVAHKAGVKVAVWLYDSNGGIDGARRISDRIAVSFQS